MDSIIIPANFEVSNITYGVPKLNDNGGKSIYLSLAKSPIVIQTPEMHAPFGKQKWDTEKGTVKYTLDLSFKNMDSRENVKTFYDKMTELDNKLVDDALENSFDWLKKKNVSRDVIQALYTKIIRHPIDKATGEVSTKYPPTFKLTLPYKDGNFVCDVYDKNKNLVDLNTIETKGARVTAIIQCMGVWVAAGKFGCTWKVLQMRVVPPSSISGYAFKDIESEAVCDDDDEDPVEVVKTVKSVKTANPTRNSSNLIDSSDDEDDLDAKMM